MQLVRSRAAAAVNTSGAERFYLHRFDAFSIGADFEELPSEQVLPNQLLISGQFTHRA
jgi:hypothetical protein